MTHGIAFWSGVTSPAPAPAPPPPAPPSLDAQATSMWACYGTSRLLSAYTGKALQVRRSSDSTTQDIAFLSGGGLDTASLLAFTGAGGAYVSIFYDQSGNGNNLTQTTAAMQPQIVNAGTYLGHLAFDGSNDNLASPAFSTPTGVSVFMRHTVNSTANARFAVLDNGNVSAASFVYDYQTSTAGFRNILATNAGANLLFGTYTGIALTDHVRALVSDITQTTPAARLQLYEEGTAQGGSFSPIGTIPTTAAFGSAAWGIGGDTDGTNAANTNLVSCVIYAAPLNSTRASAITTVLDAYA